VRKPRYLVLDNKRYLWRDILNFLAARTPEVSRDQFPNQVDILPWIKEQEIQVEGDKIVAYKVILKITFVLEGTV